MVYTDIMRFLILFLIFTLNTKAASLSDKIQKGNKVLKEDLVLDTDTFYDPNYDYTNFSGRVTDRDATGSIVKITSENKNIKYFRASDEVLFKIQNDPKGQFCEGHVRSIEENYFVLFVKELDMCFPSGEYFRRGTALILRSEKLGIRVKEASAYRATLIKKKKDYMLQLNSINQSLFSYEEKKVQVASEFDRKIAEIEAQKVKELDKILSERNDEIRLQRELAYRLDSIDKELNFYRLEKQELMFDRWHLDHDLGYPVYKRPEDLRGERASTND